MLIVKIDCSKAKFVDYFNTVTGNQMNYIYCDNSKCIFHGDRSERFANICNLNDIYDIDPLEIVNGKEIEVLVVE